MDDYYRKHKLLWDQLVKYFFTQHPQNLLHETNGINKIKPPISVQNFALIK